MSQIDCQPGQRWISNTEPELGLGIAFEVADRRVVITFPASDERRTYALDNAPLTRVRYRVADRIRSEDGAELIVAEWREADGCIVYRGLDARGDERELHEIDLDSFVQFNRPLDRMFTGQIDKLSRYELRAKTLGLQHRHQVSPVYGLLGPRVQMLPHQFYIADTVSSRHAPRVLLADEVGLGKTIEAGLVLHRLLHLGRVERALVVVPDHLIHQWLVEMLRRFNLAFSIIDAEIAEELAASDDSGNPFESAQLVLAPLGCLVDDQALLDAAEQAPWDMLIVDEAHHLGWEEDAPSAQYTAVARLAHRSSGLLLLTATPQQLGISGHFARLALLDPHRYDSLEAYLAEEQQYAAVSDLVRALQSTGDPPDGALLERITALLGTDRVAALGNAADSASRAAIVRELLDHHGTGRVLLRNCRDNIDGFPDRVLHRYQLEAPAQYRRSWPSAAAALTPEQSFDDGWLQFDPRAEWLADWLKSHRRDKTLVICASADTAQALEAWLRLRRGIRTAVFHEDMDLLQRDRAAAYFADPEEDAEALVASEIGSEGRNFQFARHLVLFDLPLNPDLLEQRIGRLDRIGQQYTVEIHVPCFSNHASSALLAWLHDGLNALERVCPAGATLYAEFAAELDTVLAQPDDDAALQDLVSRTATRRLALQEQLQRGRDRLLELNSFDRDHAVQVIKAVEQTAQAPTLRQYMAEVFDEFGVDHEDNDASSEVVQPGDHMRCESFPGLPDGGITVSYAREQALLRDDMHFLTWEHPMVAGAMDMVLGSEFGNTSFGVVKTAALAPGSVLVECLFVIVCPAPRGLRVERFLQESSLRIVVDTNGTELTERCTAQWMTEAVRAVPAATAQKVVARMRDQIEQLADHATHVCETRQEKIIRHALAQMNSILEQEISRLQQLARVNPNVRAAEVEALERDRDGYARYLQAAQLKLDAVRVVIAT